MLWPNEAVRTAPKSVVNISRWSGSRQCDGCLSKEDPFLHATPDNDGPEAVNLDHCNTHQLYTRPSPTTEFELLVYSCFVGYALLLRQHQPVEAESAEKKLPRRPVALP